MPGIDTGLDRRGAQPYGWEGRPADLPLDPQYAITSDKLNANWRQLMEAIGNVLITGKMCEEGTVTYGASTTTHCRLTLPDGFTEQYDVLHIGDGSRQWHVTVAVANEIEFSDANLEHGTAGTANYNTIQNDLMMWTLKKHKLTKTVTKNEIVTGEFDDGLHADDIQLSKTDATTVKAKTDLMDVEHEADGTHSAEIIGNNELDKDNALITQGFVNRARNGEFQINEGESQDYWDDEGTPTIVPTKGAPTAFPQFYLDISTNSLNEGISQVLKGFDANVPIRMAVYLKGAAGGEEVKLILSATSGTSTVEIELTTSWSIYYITLTPTNITTLKAFIVANTSDAIQFYAAKCFIGLGDIHTLPERGAQDAMLDAIFTTTFYTHSLVAGSDIQFARWNPLRDLVILQADAVAVTAPDANVTLRIADTAANNYDTVILNGQYTGSNTNSQAYSANDMLSVKVLTSAATTGGLCILTIQYRFA